MRLSVFYDHIEKAQKQTGKPLEELLSYVRSCGIEAVEMDYDTMLDQETTLEKCLSDAGLGISCVYGFCHLGEDAAEEKCLRIIDMARRQSCSRVLIIPGFLEQQEAQVLSAAAGSLERTAAFMESSTAVQHMRSGLQRAVLYAAQYQITVTLEDFDGETAPFARADQLRWFMEQVPGLGWTLDAGNFAYSNEDVLAAWEKLHPYLAHVHCKDRGTEAHVSVGMAGCFNRGLRAVCAGDGYIPLKELIGRLKQVGYEGFLAVEQFGYDYPYEGIAASAAYLRGCLEK